MFYRAYLTRHRKDVGRSEMSSGMLVRGILCVNIVQERAD